MCPTIRSAFSADGATYDVEGPHRLLHHLGSTGAQILEATKPNEVHAKGYTEIDTIPLYRLAYHDKTLDRDNVIQARIELHRRLRCRRPFPAGSDRNSAGHSSRKAANRAFVITVALTFVYWIGLIAGQRLGKHKTPGGHRHVDSQYVSRWWACSSYGMERPATAI